VPTPSRSAVSKSTCGAEHKSRQPRGTCLVYPVKSGGETALAGNEVRTAFEDLRGQTGGDTSRLTGERNVAHQICRQDSDW